MTETILDTSESNIRLLFVLFIGLNLLLFIRLPLMHFIIELTGRIAMYFKFDPMSGSTVAVILIHLTLTVMSFFLAQFFWRLRVDHIGAGPELMIYCGTSILILVYNILLITLAVYFTIIGD